MGAVSSHESPHDDAEENSIEATRYLISQANGTKLFRHRWNPAGAPKGIIYLSHGACEHTARYQRLAAMFAGLGLVVISHDHQGLGRSGGERGLISSFAVYVSDIFQHCDLVAEEYPQLPFYLFGHSMGGEIAILATFERPKFFKAVVLSAPAIIPDPAAATPMRVMLAKWLGYYFPSLVLGHSGTNDILSRDPIQVNLFTTDPINYQGGTKAGWAVAALAGLAQIADKMSSVEYAFLILQGTADRLVHPSGAETFYHSAKSTDKKLIIYDGYFHELLNEPEEYAKIVYDDIRLWLSERIGH